MVTTRRKEHQILVAVVVLDPIDMMDDFFRSKESFESRLHHKAMLHNVAHFIGEWVIAAKALHVSLGHESAPTFPVMMIWPHHFCF